MCGIAGWVNLKENICGQVQVIENMTKTLGKRGPDDYGYYMTSNALLGHRRLVVVDPEGGAQPMTRSFNGRLYTIVYNGELYNTEEVRKELKDKGFTFKSYSDTEVLLLSYIAYGEDCVRHINGIYAFGVWDAWEKKLFAARDPLGVKPLFYALRGNSIIFASELKALLVHPEIKPEINEEGICEIFGLGPAHALDSGVFKGVKQLPPSHWLSYSEEGLKIYEYWQLKSKPHTENLDETVEHVRSLMIDAVERQLAADVPVCTFLSGGLDSSIISSIAARKFKEQNKGQLKTYSIDYKDNDIYFSANEFQPNSDSEWIGKMAEFIGSSHSNIVLNTGDLVNSLEGAVIANDLPGMADIDSSLWLFCKEVKKTSTVALSGECADEIFGGYPWFRKEEDIFSNTFPWSKSMSERKKIISKEFGNIPLEEYVAQNYQNTISKVEVLPEETDREARIRRLFYLNMKWFMITLLSRKDRMSMSNSLEVRVPFADYRIAEYAFNIPWNMKYCDNIEKGLLRRAMKDILPHEVLYRKKSPYPKTHNPAYEKAVQSWMGQIMQDKSSPILQLIDKDEVKEIVNTAGRSLKKPWFGQLMTGPQLLAYLIQVDIWMRKYNVKIVK